MTDYRGREDHSPITVVGRTVDITPQGPVVLASSPARLPSTAVFEPLEANFILLRQGDDVFLLATLDLLYAGPAVRRGINAAMGQVVPGHVMVGASHTHYAPSTLDDKPNLGLVDQDYVEALVGRLRSCVRSMLSEAGEPVLSWSVGAGNLHHSISRRLPTRRGVKMAPNRAGPRDERATVVLVGNAQAPSAIVWNYACHPVSHPRPGMVAAHYPAVVRERLRSHFGQPNLPVLFFQGFQATPGHQPPQDYVAQKIWRFWPVGETAFTTWICVRTNRGPVRWPKRLPASQLKRPACR